MSKPLNVLILGAGGFIGSHLCEAILAKTKWHITGFDLHIFNVHHLFENERLEFKQGNIFDESVWLEDAVQKADVVLPLIAIANPALYVKEPLRVFELDFESNLAIVRLCVKYNKRVIFPSTSEVYGMCPDFAFDEDTSNFVLGPINKPRWIYSCSKQLMDRVIAAYGERDNLQYTLFRPFNFMGPRLDNLNSAEEGSSRAFTQFVGNIMRGHPIHLVNGGEQRRCYVYIDDAIDALIRIIENKNSCAAQRIFNIGNPHNDVSIRELASGIIEAMSHYSKFAEHARQTELITIQADDYFGTGYADVQSRVPSIGKAEEYLGWQPHTNVQEGIKKTLEYYFGKPE